VELWPHKTFGLALKSEPILSKNQPKKTILIVSGYSLNETVIQNRLTPIINIGLHKGFEFTIVCSGSVSLDINSSDLSYIRIDHNLAKASSFYVRAISEFLLALKLFRAASKVDSDATFVTTPSMFCLFLARRTSSLMILDIRDLTWEYLSGSMVQKIVRLALRFIAKQKIKIFDFVSCSNTSERRYLIEQMKVNLARVILISNGISESAFSKLSAIEFNEDRKKINVTYVGNIGLAQNLSILLDAAKQLLEVDFQIVGSGTQLKLLEHKVRDEKICNVFFHGRLNFNEILPIYEKSDILYAQLSKNYSTAVPSKLYEYLSTGRRVIYAGEGEATQVLSQFHDVKVIAPDNIESLVLAIREMINTPKLKGMQCQNIGIIKEKFIREKSSESLYGKISEWKLDS